MQTVESVKAAEGFIFDASEAAAAIFICPKHPPALGVGFRQTPYL